MFKALYVSWQLFFSIVACLSANPLLAQVTTDGTVNTQVNQNGNVAEITGGETRGSNLFHSFQDFSVPTGNEAFFNNADSISDIFSRVTGGNISNIDGLIRANGSANLFLINPAGIVFGESARLDIGGSFFGTTAESVLFENGEFSATDLDNPPLLTINAPIGLNFRDEPGDIVNRSIVQNSNEEVIGLEVAPGNNLTFVGGNLNFEGGNLTARGGNIEIASLSEAGILNLDENGAIAFLGNPNRGNITLSNASELDVRNSGGGNINVYANNLSLEAGDRGVSRIRAGISPDATLADGQAGDINIDTTGDISLDESRITNNQEGIGSGGNIFITTNSLFVRNGSDIASSVFGNGNAGAVNITALGDITVDGENSAGVSSTIESEVRSEGIGNSGGVTISTTNLNLTNGGEVSTDTFGTGDTGAVNIAASGDINIDGEDSDAFASAINSRVNSSAEGNSGGVNVSTTNLNLTNGGLVSTSVFGTGDAGAVNIAASGDITINGEASDGFISAINSRVNSEGVGNSGGVTISTTNLNLTNGGSVEVNIFGTGDAGAINVTASGDISIDGEDSEGLSSAIANQISSGGRGNVGGVTISTANLNLTNGGDVTASSFGTGNAGAVDVTATGNIIIDGEGSNGISSNIQSLIGDNAEGNSEGITISTTNLDLTNGGQVNTNTEGIGDAGAIDVTASGDITFTAGGAIGANTSGTGDAGAINVIASGDITIDGSSSIDGSPSGIGSAVFTGAEGNSGGVTISTTNLDLTNGGSISANTNGIGNAGTIDVTASGNIAIDGEASNGSLSAFNSLVSTVAEGNSGGVRISTTNLNLANGGQINTSTFGNGDAGAIDVTATGNIAIDGEGSNGAAGGIVSLVGDNAEGNSEGVRISTTNLNLTNGGRINTSTFGNGDAGAIDVTATGNIAIDGEGSNGVASAIVSVVGPNAGGNSGGVTISTTNLDLANGGAINASTGSSGNAGAIGVTATDNIAIDGEASNGFPSGIFSLVSFNAEGNSGGVTVSTTDLNLTNGGQVTANTFGNGDASDVTIDAEGSISIDGSTNLFRSGVSANAVVGDGNAGNIFIYTDSLSINNNGTIEATNFNNLVGLTPGTGQPGSINITTNSIDLADNARIEAATQFAEGQSGIINLQVAEDITLRDNSFISAQAFGDANGGNLNIDSRFIIAFPSNGTGNDLVAAADSGTGGNINLDVEQLFGFAEGRAIDRNNNAFLANNTNDLDISGNLEGSLNITTNNIDPLQGATELPIDIVEPSETTQQACASNRESAAKNGLAILGKGGVPPAPDLPLNSLNTISNGAVNSVSAIPAPIETSKGKIQLARGIEVTESGEIKLVAYRTNDAGDRLPEIKPNCG